VVMAAKSSSMTWQPRHDVPDAAATDTADVVAVDAVFLRN